MRINGKHFVLAAAMAALGGCSSAPEQVGFVPVLPSANVVYANLTKTPAGYRFTEFVVNPEQLGSGSWVNLQTGAPAWDIESKYCGTGMYFKKEGRTRIQGCGNLASEDKFLESNYDEANLVMRTLISPFTFGLSLAGSSYDIEFDEKSFNKAVREAASALDKSVLSKSDEALTEWDSEIKVMQDANHAAWSSWRDTVKIELNDRSGLYKDSTLRLSDYVGVRKPTNTTLKQVQAKNAQELFLNVMSAKQASLTNSAQKYSQLKVVCSSPTKAYDYHLNVYCPEAFAVDLDTQQARGNVEMDVVSRDYNNVYPQQFDMQNRDLHLTMRGGRIGLSSKTSEFITIKSVSLYYNGQITTRSGLGIDLPPNAELLDQDKLLIRKFNIVRSALNFPRQTKADVKRTKTNYGFAVKYVISGQAGDKTLYKNSEYSLADLVL
ncbi:hypothetical protein [Vibrio sp.]|uniref:hypothetical protein n=1 Tax=Vibrio sp. TaxID=678 RepID=UPI003D09DC3D